MVSCTAAMQVRSSAHRLDPPGAAQRAVVPAVVVVLLLSFALKLAVLYLVGDIRPFRDEQRYLEAGVSLAAGRGIEYEAPNWDELHAPPLYPLFMGLVTRLGGGAYESKVAQVFLSTFTVAFLYLLARRWFDVRAALWGTGLAAFYPTLVAFTHYNWVETFFLFWFCAALLALFDARGAPASPARTFAGGLLFGAAALTRAEAFYLLPLLVLWIGAREGRARPILAKGGSLVLGGLLALLPWIGYAYSEHGALVPISTGSTGFWHFSYNAYPPSNQDLGVAQAASRAPHKDEARRRARGDDPIERMRKEQRRALQFIAENPLLCVRRFFVRVGLLLNPTSFLIRHVRKGYYTRAHGERPERAAIPPAAADAIVWSTVAAYLAVSVLAVLGLSVMPAGPRAFLLLVTLYFVVVYGATYAISRYRLSFMPLLALAAGYAVAHRAECLERLRRPGTAIPVFLVLAVLGFAWSLHFDKLWNH